MTTREIELGPRCIEGLSAFPDRPSTRYALAAALGLDVELLGERMDGHIPYQQVRIAFERAGRTDTITLVLGPFGPIKARVVASGDLASAASIRTVDGITVGDPFARVAALAEHACAVEQHDAVQEVFWAKPRTALRYRLGAPGLALPENLWSETAEAWVAANAQQLLVTSIVWGSSLGPDPFSAR